MLHILSISGSLRASSSNTTFMRDWLVSFEGFPGMPVALYNTSARACDAQRALRLVLETMSAVIIEPACVTVNLLGSSTSAAALEQNDNFRLAIQSSLDHMKSHIATSGRTASQSSGEWDA